MKSLGAEFVCARYRFDSRCQTMTGRDVAAWVAAIIAFLLVVIFLAGLVFDAIDIIGVAFSA
jgi:hypothetical protein